MISLSQCEKFPLTHEELGAIWQTTRDHAHFPDDDVALQCVSIDEIHRLNKEYRNKDAPTNILTFSYVEDGDHDVALCMDIAKKEATDRGMELRDYVALLVTHGLLHVCGIDHELSEEQSHQVNALEREIMIACGFVPKSLSDVY